VLITPGSLAGALYGTGAVEEDFFCNYGLNPDYRPLFEADGLRVTGVDDQGAVRIVELERHPFFLATLYCFQTRSRPGDPHPLVAGLVDAARRLRRAA
jgi:CTP synthase (UTP-ammonia lyase)